MGSKYVLVDEEFQNRVLEELKMIKTIIADAPLKKSQDQKDLMDTADAMAFLNVDRRTLYAYLEKGLPSTQVGRGKIYYSREKLLQFLSDQNIKNV
jgi:hypothetical protein